MDLTTLIPSLVSVGGLVAVILGALRFNRDEATHQIALMRQLNDELEDTLNRKRTELAEAHAELDELRRRGSP